MTQLPSTSKAVWATDEYSGARQVTDISLTAHRYSFEDASSGVYNNEYFSRQTGITTIGKKSSSCCIGIETLVETTVFECRICSLVP